LIINGERGYRDRQLLEIQGTELREKAACENRTGDVRKI
jgi:hypothetical protein